MNKHESLGEVEKWRSGEVEKWRSEEISLMPNGLG